MPDAFENYNVAIRSMLTANAVADAEESYYPFTDLAPISNASGLSPYSSGSQGNISVTSPMSISSSSPMHVMDDYINLNNASVTILGEPYINILVQPMEKFRFRYISEMVGTHGSLLGASTSRRRNKNNVPTVQLCNFPERAVIRCLLVTTDEDHRIPHAHRLVRRVGTDDVDDPHDIEVSSNNDFTAEFNSMGIIHTARKNVKDELVRKLRAEILEERRRLNINATLSVRDEAQIKADAEQYQKCINLNSVALCFQGFIKDQYGITRPITAPVYSNPINNLKSALTGELKICRIDKYTSSCEGGEEVFILVEKVSKKNIKIKFFELNDDDIEVWADYGRFSELDVHHQYAMVFRTPPYKDLNITTPREVFIQLERPSDSDCSEPIKFTYKPTDRIIGRKRTRVSHSNSAELAQAAFNQDSLSMNVPLTNMPSNESIEMFKEITRILDDGCSSSEFRKCVADMDVGFLEPYANLVEKTKENLTYDGASSKKDAESFAKNIVIDILNNIKKKPTDAKNIIMNLLKDRTIYGDSPLHCALRFGQKDTVKRILMLMSTLNTDARDLTNIPNTSGKTPLHYAVLQNQPEITKALLMLCANPNIADHSGQMPLHTAANCPEAGMNVDVLLSEKKTNIEAHTDLGWTPLQLAAEAGSYHAMRSLIEAGAEVNNTEMSYGRTALHIAVEGGHRDIVEFLLKNTIIDVNKKNFSGNTALHNAVVTQGAKAKEICALLLKYGADPYIKNHNRPDVEETQVQNIKTEAHSEDDNMEECAGESSFDLASNKLDILQLISGQGDVSEKRGFVCKEENIVDTEKVWMDADQEKQLATILDETKGWKKLADHLNFDYLLKTFERNSFSSPALLLLNYIAVQTHISLGELQSILQNMGEEYAATYLQQVLSFN
ncbi:nuclear factor NF-kappa-B p110 subunit isoform X2 [Ooceraea biroi]|uniref:nuclear factor NF-kappa-B p110 subunit isoform X2 n=1 Tax=Ooceraea biroi TaxID=2015173 RepID=UPI000F0732F6|nr:nuclear factor NF-kappa-B p110 subunit isoform X2 [Ooceraea biroi]